MKQCWGKWAVVSLSSIIWLTACATRPPTSLSAAATQARIQIPLLPPSDWGGSWAQEQLLSIDAHGQKHQVQVMLEVSEQRVRLAILKFGQRLVVIQYDATGITEEKGAYVPEFIQAQQVLQDMQVVYAKADALGKIVQPHCTVTDTVNQRQIVCGGQAVYLVDYGVNGAQERLQNIRLQNIQSRYYIQIDAVNQF